MSPRILFPALLAVVACQGNDTNAASAVAPIEDTRPTMAHDHGSTPSRVNDPLPEAQLAQVRRATARYHDVAAAVADGYHDINVVIPNMGRHFLKDSLVDARFDLEHPELLVYSPDEHGRLVLGAVEYAIPLGLSATAPEGFRGSSDQWFADQHFQLWTLHAWVWKENPDGLFNPTNRRVP